MNVAGFCVRVRDSGARVHATLGVPFDPAVWTIYVSRVDHAELVDEADHMFREATDSPFVQHQAAGDLRCFGFLVRPDDALEREAVVWRCEVAA